MKGCFADTVPQVSVFQTSVIQPNNGLVRRLPLQPKCNLMSRTYQAYALNLNEGDQQMIDLLRRRGMLSIGQLVEGMGVTATAVRQRLTRLMALGLVSRNHSIEGRGRPSYLYQLTDKGERAQPNNLGDLAEVLWNEVRQIADRSTRDQIILGAVQRLADKYESEVHGSTTAERMEAITQLFAERSIPVEFEQNDGLPLIKVSGCPYPTLVKEDRQICDLEKELLSRIIGHPVTLCQCQHDGDSCCIFRPQLTETLTTSAGKTF